MTARKAHDPSTIDEAGNRAWNVTRTNLMPEAGCVRLIRDPTAHWWIECHVQPLRDVAPHPSLIPCHPLNALRYLARLHVEIGPLLSRYHELATALTLAAVDAELSLAPRSKP